MYHNITSCLLLVHFLCCTLSRPNFWFLQLTLIFLLKYSSNGLPQPFSLFPLYRMFNLSPTYFAIQPTTPLTLSLYFLLLPSMLIYLIILVSPLTNFLSSLHYHQSSIYIYIHFFFPFSFSPSLLSAVSTPSIILHHHFRSYKTQISSQLV